VTTLEFAVAVIAVALVFDFANGWHDSANSIATVVATRVLSPRAAVVWAAFGFRNLRSPNHRAAI
jgi:PiT family inorganic phosphate transporter